MSGKYYFEVSMKDYHRLIECIHTYTRNSYRRIDMEREKNPDYQPRLKPLDVMIHSGCSKWNLDLSRASVFRDPNLCQPVQAPTLKRKRKEHTTINAKPVILKRKYKKRKIDTLPEDGAIYIEHSPVIQLDLTEYKSSSAPPCDTRYAEMAEENTWEIQTPITVCDEILSPGYTATPPTIYDNNLNDCFTETLDFWDIIC